MPRANRSFLPGYVWHITHRCHKREFLLKFAKDRWCWRHWLFEAKKRYGLCVLNYIVTSNHVHLLVLDTGKEVIANSMQLIAGRTAQAYNRRKQRKGAYWEDRYHGTAVESDHHLAQCIAYIDMNMVRAGVVRHPGEWSGSGYCEIQQPPKRYTIINMPALMELLGFKASAALQQAHEGWIETLLAGNDHQRQSGWSEGIAIGSEAFVTNVKAQLGLRAKHREIVQAGDMSILKEDALSYTDYFRSGKVGLSNKYTVVLDEY